MIRRALIAALVFAAAAGATADTNAVSAALTATGYVEIPLQAAGVGQLYLPVHITGQPYTFIVDTGASISLISEPIVEALKIPIHPKRTVQMTEIGGRINTHRVTEPVFIEIDGHLLPPQEFAVADLRRLSAQTVKSGGKDVNGILGGVWLRRHGAVLDYGNSRLFLKGVMGGAPSKPADPAAPTPAPVAR